MHRAILMATRFLQPKQVSSSEEKQSLGKDFAWKAGQLREGLCPPAVLSKDSTDAVKFVFMFGLLH